MSNTKNTVEYLEKPWGFLAVLSDVGHYKVNELVIQPGHGLERELHWECTERWTVMEGHALVNHQEKETHLYSGDTYVVPLRTMYSVKNLGEEPLVVLGAQFLMGEFLGETGILFRKVV
jgi:mannose-1-phosphate guanylyltransferase/mannose-6-phosphate isomerase